MKKYLILLLRRPFAGCLIFCATACHQQQPLKKWVVTPADSLARDAKLKRAYQNIYLASRSIQNGDLITRTGSDFTSEGLRSLNQRNKTYSHCGIACIENDSVFVYHALGGEWNPDQKIRRDWIVQFADPYDNKGMGIFRFNLPEEEKKQLTQTIHAFFNKGIMFDMDFNLQTDDRMYCAEFVYKAFKTATGNRLLFHTSRIKDFEFVGVDDLFLEPSCQLQQQIVYK